MNTKMNWEWISDSHYCCVHRVYNPIYWYNDLNILKGITFLQEIFQIQIQRIQYSKYNLLIFIDESEPIFPHASITPKLFSK